MNSRPAATSTQRPLDTRAVALMLVLCLSWGFNQIAIKFVLLEIPPYLQAGIRSAGALVVILLVARLRGTRMFERDGTLTAGILIGLVFGIEFILVYHGIALTTASRASVFLYTSPFFVAAGSVIWLGERLRLAQWMGLALCFAGVAVAIGVPQAGVDARVLWGDLSVVAGAALWAATTLMVKATSLAKAPAEKVLAYQVAISVPLMALAAWAAGERIAAVPGALTLILMAIQAIWIVGLTFTIWVGLVKAYSASKLSAFTFITPLIGVAGGYLVMHDQLTAAFGVAAVLVIAGLFLVNRPAPRKIDPLLTVTKS